MHVLKMGTIFAFSEVTKLSIETCYRNSQYTPPVMQINRMNAVSLHSYNSLTGLLCAGVSVKKTFLVHCQMYCIYLIRMKVGTWVPGPR